MGERNYPVRIKVDVPFQGISEKCLEGEEIGCDASLVIALADRGANKCDSSLVYADSFGKHLEVEGVIAMIGVITLHLLDEPESLTPRERYVLEYIQEAVRRHRQHLPDPFRDARVKN